MSHLVKKECSMTDLDTILETARSLGWRVEAGGRVKYFAGYGEECQYVLWLEGEQADHGQELG